MRNTIPHPCFVIFLHMLDVVLTTAFNPTVKDRVHALHQLADILEAHLDELSYLDSVSWGKARSLFAYEGASLIQAIRCELQPTKIFKKSLPVTDKQM